MNLFKLRQRNIKQEIAGGALLFACKHGWRELVHMLIEFGTDVKVSSNHGDTLILASMSGNIDCMKSVLLSGAEVNRSNLDGGNAFTTSQTEDSIMLLCAAGEMISPSVPTPECLKFEDLQLQLQHICREAIRKHLLDLDPHSNLFCRIAGLGLPAKMKEFLLYGVSLDDEDEEEKDDNDYYDNASDSNNSSASVGEVVWIFYNYTILNAVKWRYNL